MVSESGYYTPAYCSPEQEAGVTLTRRTDIWSWAICVLEMFLGDHFWFNGTAAGCACEDYFEMELKVPLTEALKDLLLWCFELKEAERLHDFTLIDTELQKIYRAAAGSPYPRPPIQAATNTADSLNNRALSFLDIGRPEEAEKCWEEALKTNPGHADSLYNRSLYLWRSAKIDDLEALRLVKSNATNADYHLALLHIGRSDAKKAMKCLNRAREAEGETERITKNLVTAYRMEKEERDGRLLHTFDGSSSFSVCFSPDGQLVLAGNGTLWDVTTGKLIHRLKGHTKNIYSACFSPDGRLVLSGSQDKTLKLWDIVTGECIRTFEGHINYVISVCFSPDGRSALSGSGDNTIKLWDIASGRCTRSFWGHFDEVHSVCFSPDGQRALSGSYDHTMKLWDIASGKCIRDFAGNSDWVRSVCFSSDGQWALSGSNIIKLWDVASGECIHSFGGHTASVRSVCFSPDEQFVLSGNDDKTVKLWDIASGRCIRSFEGLKNADAVCFSPDGRQALSGSSNWDCMELWRLPVGAEPVEWQLSRIHSTDVSIERTTLFRSLTTGIEERITRNDIPGALEQLEELRKIRLFGDSRTCYELTRKLMRYCLKSTRIINHITQIINTGEYAIYSICFSPSGQQILSGNNYDTMKLWNISTGDCIRIFGRGGEKHIRIWSVCFSPDGQWALSDGDTIKLWNVETGGHIRSFEGKGESCYVRSVCFSPDGQLALSGIVDTTIALWDVATGKCIRTGKHIYTVASAFSPDGRLALSAGWVGYKAGNSIKLWDVASGKRIRIFKGHIDSINSVCFNSDGCFALSGSWDNTIKLWNVATGECIRTFEGHTDQIGSVCFSPDGQLALSGSHDYTVKLWDIATGECIRTWEEKDYVFSACFSPDGTRIAAAVKNEIHIYHLEFALHFPGWADWDEGAQPYLDIFRKVHPNYTEKDVQRFLTELQYRGYGWLRPEGVRKRLASR
jgi:WD40 repeat protein